MASVRDHPGGRSGAWLSAALLGLALAGCQVRLVEDHDPEIARGLSAYQAALETFTLRLMEDYRRCGVAREHLQQLRATECAAQPAGARETCRQRVDAQARDLDARAAAACAAASYEANAEGFYYPNEALLRVLLVRARVLDASGTCIAAVEGIARLATSVSETRLRRWVLSPAAGNVRNCTEVQVQQILANHQHLQAVHRQLDSLDATGGGAALQAQLALPLVRGTVEQTIGIALFLEQAKKRGAP